MQFSKMLPLPVEGEVPFGNKRDITLQPQGIDVLIGPQKPDAVTARKGG
jgi:hypothetical protein